ncbi:hypothetical protein BJ992_002249 [Sphaerisporangium rubeum]|uniref:Uncharacterized protein n=1 Tax=Sphaerisporangium rubeum TaxID=321317 RepID=A0A7X0M5L8_9ACTN|nr:hypothetical protein [Sphaerisporangium rubeum]
MSRSSPAFHRVVPSRRALAWTARRVARRSLRAPDPRTSGLVRRWHVTATFPRNALGVSRKWSPIRGRTVIWRTFDACAPCLRTLCESYCTSARSFVAPADSPPPRPRHHQTRQSVCSPVSIVINGQDLEQISFTATPADDHPGVGTEGCRRAAEGAGRGPEGDGDPYRCQGRVTRSPLLHRGPLEGSPRRRGRRCEGSSGVQGRS